MAELHPNAAWAAVACSVIIAVGSTAFWAGQQFSYRDRITLLEVNQANAERLLPPGPIAEEFKDLKKKVEPLASQDSIMLTRIDDLIHRIDIMNARQDGDVKEMSMLTGKMAALAAKLDEFKEHVMFVEELEREEHHLPPLPKQ